MDSLNFLNRRKKFQTVPLKVLVETGVRMNENDYSLDNIPKKEYDQLKEQYNREPEKFLKRTK